MQNAAVLFVYYKVDAAQHAACLLRVRQFQVDLQRAWPGLHMELMQRPETAAAAAAAPAPAAAAAAAAGVETWMETYRHLDGLTEQVMAGIENAAAAAGLPAPRHAERFVLIR